MLLLLQWIVILVAGAALLMVLVGDFWAGKSKHSSYYSKVQKPEGKDQRQPLIPDPSVHDRFYTKLNSH